MPRLKVGIEPPLKGLRIYYSDSDNIFDQRLVVYLALWLQLALYIEGNLRVVFPYYEIVQNVMKLSLS